MLSFLEKEDPTKAIDELLCFAGFPALLDTYKRIAALIDKLAT
jgi:hypothetical protein